MGASGRVGAPSSCSTHSQSPSCPLLREPGKPLGLHEAGDIGQQTVHVHGWADIHDAQAQNSSPTAFSPAASRGLLPHGTLPGAHSSPLTPGQTLLTLQISLKPHFSKRRPPPAGPPCSEAREELLSIVSFPKTKHQEASTALIVF